MAKSTIPPTCKYHPDVKMKLVIEPNGEPAIFNANVVQNHIVKLGSGYAFHVYECPQCTYLEFHDY